MIITEQPHDYDLFGINPRWVVVEKDTPEAHRVQLQLSRFEDDGSSTDVVTLNNVYQDENEVVFNLSNLLQLDYDLPELSAIQSFEKETAARVMTEYNVFLNEFDAAGTHLLQRNFRAYAIQGGRSVLENRRFSFESWLNSRKFLTMQPESKTVTREQPEWLYYVLWDDTNADVLIHRLAVELTFSDGTTQSVLVPPASTPGDFSFTGAAGNIIYFTTGFTQMELEQYEDDDKFILSYRVRLNTYTIDGNSPSGTQIGTLLYSSAFQKYVVDYDTRSWETRYYLFQNHLGGMDVLATRGKAEITSKQSRSSRSVTETRTMDYSQHPRRANRPTSRTEVKVNIGWINREEREWIEDLVLSANVWEIKMSTRANEFIPILITSDNLALHQDDDSLQSAAFTYEYAEKSAR